MRKLLNTLYVFTENMYLSLDGENIVARVSDEEVGRIPLHTLESVLSFSYAGASPALMGACAEKGIWLSFFTPRGRFLASVSGESKGNVLLRKEQYRWAENNEKALEIAKLFIIGKVYNGRWVLSRTLRDHALRVNCASLESAVLELSLGIERIKRANGLDELRGIEGELAASYFGVFDEMILRDKEFFTFRGRNRRPPKDAVNAMLSLFYSVLAADCASALEGQGLDAFVGFLHADRPGRRSLALDLTEEFRAVLVDRFVLTAINNRIVTPSDFLTRDTGEVRLADDGRKRLFEAWQERKKEQLMHPFLKQKVPRGLLPYIQAQLLVRYIRGDLDAYPVFLWK